jgi:hypothetical protein
MTYGEYCDYQGCAPLPALEWVTKARDTMRELDAEYADDRLGDAVDDLNHAIAALERAP